MSTNRQGILAGIAIVMFAAIMGLFHYMMTGFSDQFGWGFGIGTIMGGGLVILASRNARHTF